MHGNFADYVNHSSCLARAGDAKALVLIEASTSAAAGEVTGIFDGTAELQKNRLDLIVNYKCGSDEYGVKAAKYGHKPLYVKTVGGAQRCFLLHRVQAGRFPELQERRVKIQGGG